MLPFAKLCLGMGLPFWPPVVALDAVTLLGIVVKVALLVEEWVLCNCNSHCCCNGCSCVNGGDFTIWVSQLVLFLL